MATAPKPIRGLQPLSRCVPGRRARGQRRNPAPGDRAWITKTRQGIYSPLGDGSGSPHGKPASPSAARPTTRPRQSSNDRRPGHQRRQRRQNQGPRPVWSATLVTLDKTKTKTVEVDNETIDGTAVGGQDSTHVGGRLSFQPGDTRQTIYVPVINDDHEDNGETVRLELSIRSNATIGDGRRQDAYNDVGPPVEQPELTARFENMASEHDGETVLAVRRRFSEDRVVRYRLLRDEAFNVSGARSRRFGVLTAAMTCARCTSSRKRPETSASSLPAGMGLRRNRSHLHGRRSAAVEQQQRRGEGADGNLGRGRDRGGGGKGRAELRRDAPSTPRVLPTGCRS